MAAVGVDIPALKARHLLGDTVEASGVRLVVEGAGCGRESAPSTTRPRVASRSTPTRSGSTASAAAPAGTCWTSSSGPRASR